MPPAFRSRLVRQLATVVTLGLLVLSTGTAASVIVAGDTPRRVARMDAASPFQVEGFRTAHLLRASIDSLIAPLGPTEPLDAQAVRGDRDGVLSTAAEPLPHRTAQRIWQLHDANERVADSALDAGDIATAMMRARENIAVARHYLDEPYATDVLVGRNLLKRGARLMQRVALVGDAPQTATAAKELERLVDRTFAGAPVYSRLHRYARDAASPQLLALANDRSVYPAIRLASLGGIVLGACLNTREVLFGIDDDRRAAFDAAVAAVADIPRSAELVPRYREQLARATGVGVALALAAGTMESATTTPRAFERLVPAQVRARVAFCRANLGR